MNSRRNFFRTSALIAGATALPGKNLLASTDDVVQTTATTTGKLPYKKHLR